MGAKPPAKVSVEPNGGHIQGVAIVSAEGKILGALGVANDPRIKAAITDPDWMREAHSNRLAPLRIGEAELVVFLARVPSGSLVVISTTPGETVSTFLTTVGFAFDIIEHVLTDPYDAMVVVDAKARVAFISPVHEKFYGFKPGEAIGKPVRDVIENTRLDRVVRTGVAEVGQVHRTRGLDRIVSRHPIRRGGEIVGAIGRVMFKGPQQVEVLAQRVRALEHEITTYKQSFEVKGRGEAYLEAIVGDSLAIRSVRQQIRKIAPLDIPVLIHGDSGTGKELVAQALHMLSLRQDGRLVTINAAALPESLVESELFGYEPGSFTGADRKGRPGKFELADKGTIFLDEIGDMPLEAQSKLLRVLQDRMVERVGAEKPKRVDFRLCSATNKDLEELVEQGRFRLDLFYRISPVQISLPALNERLEDIPLLTVHCLQELSKQYNRSIPEIDLDVYDYLMGRTWPGNIRQLKHEIETAFVLLEGTKLGVSDFRQGKAVGSILARKQNGSHLEHSTADGNLKAELEKIESHLIRDALTRFKGNKKKTAESLGVSRSYLYKKLEELRI
jgi:transcriptional regulator with PAS, ATPase and Fis domain